MHPAAIVQMSFIYRSKSSDPFLSLIAGQHKVAIVNRLEYSRVKKESQYTKVYEFEALRSSFKIIINFLKMNLV